MGERLALLIDDVWLNYKVEGRGECIILIHGIGGTLHDFDPIAGKLAERFRVLRYDQRGFGGSDKPLSKPYTNELWADDLHKLLKKLRIGKAILIGHSMGGRIACHFAAKYSTRTKALITLNTTMWGSNPVGAERLREAVKRLTRSDMNTILDMAPWFQGLKRKSPDIAKFLRDETLANDPAAYALASESVAADFAGETNHSLLRKIRCPTLIVIGDKDSASIKGALEMCELITNSQLAIIPDCGHFSMYEKPRVLLAMIMEFISDLTE